MSVTVTSGTAATYRHPRGRAYRSATGRRTSSKARRPPSGGAATGTINVRAVEAGIAGTLPVADVFTLRDGVVEAQPTGAVASDASAETRRGATRTSRRIIIALMREQPGSGNTARLGQLGRGVPQRRIRRFDVPVSSPASASFPGAGATNCKAASRRRHRRIRAGRQHC